MRCLMCGDEFIGKIIIGDKWGRKEKKSKYCQACYDIKGNTHASTFIKHAKKITSWQDKLPAYLESLNSPFPCIKCGKEHMTRPGGPAMCKSCLSAIKDEREKERKALAEKEEELRKINYEKTEKMNELKRKIIKELEKDDTFRKYLVNNNWTYSRWVFLKEEMKIDAYNCSVEMWDKKNPNSIKNSWRSGSLIEISHRLPPIARKIIEENPDIFNS